MKLVAGEASIEDVDAFVETLDEIGAKYECAVQAFDARYIAGRAHLAAAVEQANQAFERDDTIADDRGVEILCYAAGRRQINQALAMGVKEGAGPVVVVVDGRDEADAVAAVEDLVTPGGVLGQVRDEVAICSFFDIPDAEREATSASLEELVIERVALLVINK